MSRICIVTGAHLCRNPRVVKEAHALGETGHDVVVLGPKLSDDLAAQDATLGRGAPWAHRYVVDVSGAGGPGRYLHRAVRRGAVEGVARAGWALPDALGYGVRRTLQAALDERADLTIGHQEVGAWVAAELLRLGRPAGADIEDWYSRDLLPEDRAGRPVALLERTERSLVQNGLHVTTTSHALANALGAAVRRFSTCRRLQRLPLERPRCPRRRGRGPYQPRHALTPLGLADGGAGPGARRLVRGAGVGPYAGFRCISGAAPVPGAEAALRAAFPSEKGHRLVLHGLVPPGKLLSRITEHDVGIALEETTARQPRPHGDEQDFALPARRPRRRRLRYGRTARGGRRRARRGLGMRDRATRSRWRTA